MNRVSRLCSALHAERGSRYKVVTPIVAAFVASLSLATTAPAGPLDGWSSANVEFVRNVPVGHFLGELPATDAVLGATVRGRLLYVTGTGLTIFDISDPENPLQLSELPYIGIGLTEDPTTNGRILPVGVNASDYTNGSSSQDLIVIDVSDPTNPVELARATGLGGHTVTCVAKCRWAYASNGKIVDLRDPANPKLATSNWCDAVRAFLNNPPAAFESTDCAHDVTEVAPGLVLTASVPMFLFDATKPDHPRVIARSDGSPYSWGGVLWPRRGRDRWIISFAESGGLHAASCKLADTQQGGTLNTAIKTWDARNWIQNRLFTGGDEYVAADGTFSDGNPPASGGGSLTGCSPGWFDPHPSFHNQGLVAAAYLGNGVKFLDVGPDGGIEEVGFWLPTTAPVFGSISARWINQEIVYAFGFLGQGVDILRFTSEM